MRFLLTGGCGLNGANFVLHMLDARPGFSIVNLDKFIYFGNRTNPAHLEKLSCESVKSGAYRKFMKNCYGKRQ